MRAKYSDEFGPVLRMFRHAAALTQEELSERLGVAAPYVSMLESGRKYPNLEMLFKLAAALNIQPNTLIAAMEERLAKRGR